MNTFERTFTNETDYKMNSNVQKMMACPETITSIVDGNNQCFVDYYVDN